MMKASLLAIEARLDGLSSSDMYIVNRPNLYINFLGFDCTVANVALGCFNLPGNNLCAVIRYEDACGYTRVFRGQISLAKGNATMDATVKIFNQLKTADSIRADVIFDGQMSVDTDFDLHLHFPAHGLTVHNVARANNPLTVIDLFR